MKFRPKAVLFYSSKHGWERIISTFIVGATLIFVGFVLRNEFSIDTNWIRSTGSVSQVTQKEVSEGPEFVSTISYSTEGRDFTITEHLKSNSPPQVGSSREIAFNPANPAEAKVVRDGSYTVYANVLFVVGAYFSMVAIYSTLKKIKSS